MENSGRFRRFSLNQATVTTSLFPQDNEETIYNTKPPFSPGLDLSDSVCSFNSSTTSVRRRCESESNRDGNDNVAYDFCSGSNYNSEPEDMQDYISVQNKSSVNTVDCLNSSIDKDKSLENMGKSDDFGSLVYTSSPLALRGKKVSLSLQDMSSIETFPLLPKTNNGFSSETIPSQSLSSTSKSKDSGFQRSASCLSLNSGNRTYDHVQSKVKQYIRDIKNSEESRKRQKQSMFNLPKDSLVSQKKSDTTCSINSIAETVDNDSEIVRSVSVLKNELKEKDSTLKQLQENYNSLLQKYAEAVNQIDLMRLRNSLNNSYRSDFTVSNEDLTDNNLHYSNNLFPASNSTHNNRPIHRCESGPDYTSSLPNRLSSMSFSNVHDQCSEEASKEPLKSKSESLDYQVFHSKQDSKPSGMLQTKEDRPQSSSSSTLVSSSHRTKTLTLGPISKYYSSSSRLGMKQNAPLPSSMHGKSVSYIEQSPQDRNGSQKNAVLTSTEDSLLRSYRMRNISKVNPFERVHSYLENFRKMREDSLPTKIDSNRGSSSDDSANQAYDSHFIETNKSINHCTSQSELSKHEGKQKTNRSKSEQNLFGNEKIFSELSKQNGKSSAGRSLQHNGRRSDGLLNSYKKSNIRTDAFQLRGSEKLGKTCSRNLLARSDAFDSLSSLDENFSDDVDDFGGDMGFGSKEKHSTDDSSSISSSIFSLPKDDGYSPSLNNNNSRSPTETEWKNVSHTKSVKSTVWEKRKSCQSLSSLPKRKKPDRVCFSPKNRRVPERKSTVKTPSQEDLDCKPCTSSSSNKKTEFRRKLKIYTEILKAKPNRDIGVQVSDTKNNPKQFEDSEDLSNVNRLDCLNDASEYLKQMKRDMDRLCDYIENLKVDPVNKKSVRFEGRL